MRRIAMQARRARSCACRIYSVPIARLGISKLLGLAFFQGQPCVAPSRDTLEVQLETSRAQLMELAPIMPHTSLALSSARKADAAFLERGRLVQH